MPEDRRIPGSPQDWLARAKSDLAIARVPLPDQAFYEDLCFHAEQAAEKAFKAVYRHHGWAFRYTHDLDELVGGLKRQGLRIAAEVEDAIVLTSFAWEARYPGTWGTCHSGGISGGCSTSRGCHCLGGERNRRMRADDAKASNMAIRAT